ncbi:MAG: transcription termination/antitermination protein NusA, partial [Lachnospiraceae bacterium]|nr:transcription termination/antitermination protein NusA [Lachnospiraceae bacterium]
IENALNPAKVVAIAADIEEKKAIVIVPDNQLSLAIGQKGQNVRLAHRLTDFAIDIKSLTEAYELGLLDGYTGEEDDEYDEDEYEEYEDGEYEDDAYEDGEEESDEADADDEAEAESDADADAEEAEADGSDED